MIEIDGSTLWRGGEKIGWVENYRVYAKDGYELGYYENGKIYDRNGHELGWIEGDYLKTPSGNSIKLEYINDEISGGDFSELARAAVRLLLGD